MSTEFVAELLVRLDPVDPSDVTTWRMDDGCAPSTDELARIMAASPSDFYAASAIRSAEKAVLVAHLRDVAEDLLAVAAAHGWIADVARLEGVLADLATK